MVSLIDDEELARIQQKIYNDAITMPEERERLILDTAKYVANGLYFTPEKIIKVEFLEHRYNFKGFHEVVNFKNLIKIVIVDENEMAHDINGNECPRTFSICAEVDNTLSMIENYRGCICAFLRQQSGDYTPEELED